MKEIRTVDMEGNAGVINGFSDLGMEGYTPGSIEDMTNEELFYSIEQDEAAKDSQNPWRGHRINLEALAVELNLDFDVVGLC